MYTVLRTRLQMLQKRPCLLLPERVGGEPPVSLNPSFSITHSLNHSFNHCVCIYVLVCMYVCTITDQSSRPKSTSTVRLSTAKKARRGERNPSPWSGFPFSFCSGLAHSNLRPPVVTVHIYIRTCMHACLHTYIHT